MESEITGKITNRDFLSLELYQRRYSFLFMWLLGIIASMFVFPLELYSFVNKIILLGIPSMSYVLFLFLVIMILNQREYRSLSKRLYERVIQINEEGIHIGDKERKRSVEWSEIKKVVFLKRIILLYPQKNHPMLIPKHFFSSSTQEKEWIEFIKQHVPN